MQTNVKAWLTVNKLVWAQMKLCIKVELKRMCYLMRKLFINIAQSTKIQCYRQRFILSSKICWVKMLSINLRIKNKNNKN
jgi:hypothetical protein